jgi:predicted component of viral defense system (DUF524 family)
MSNPVRCQQIEKSISEAYTLIGQLEHNILVTHEPLDRACWQTQIEEQKAATAKWENEQANINQPTLETPKSSTTSMSLTELQQKLTEQFNLRELRDLCFELGVDHEELASDVKSELSREMIGYLKRRGRLAELINRVQELRLAL